MRLINFSAGTSGGAAIRALSAPFSGMTFIPTGGIELKNSSTSTMEDKDDFFPHMLA